MRLTLWIINPVRSLYSSSFNCKVFILRFASSSFLIAAALPGRGLVVLPGTVLLFELVSVDMLLRDEASLICKVLTSFCDEDSVDARVLFSVVSR